MKFIAGSNMKNRIKAWSLFFFFFIGSPGEILSKDFGIMGQNFPIIEESFLEFLQRNSAGKDLNQKIRQAKEVLLKKAKNPFPVSKLSKAKQSKVYTLDLTFQVDKDIFDTNGNIIACKGTQINPLEKIELSTGLLFFDGNDKQQLEWASKQPENFKWILVAGKPLEIEEKEKRPVYFDQKGS
jgi:conjugal transfer pilus assembly protein TraW